MNAGSLIPYIIELGDEKKGLTESEKKRLENFESNNKESVIHCWLWWDKGNPFKQYREHGRDEPKWRRYSDDDGAKIEAGYQMYQTGGNERCDINTERCALFNCTYKEKRLMVQGSISDEENKTMKEEDKKRRPINRASFCWFYGAPDTVVPDAMSLLPGEIAIKLEKEYAKGAKTAALQAGNADFERGTLMAYNGATYKIARLGTPVKSGCQVPLPIPPSTWVGDNGAFNIVFKFDPNLNGREKGIINRMISIGRIQNFVLFDKYNKARKMLEPNKYTRLDGIKNPMVNDYDSTEKSDIPHNINEFYMFRAVQNPLDVTNGEIPISVDQSTNVAMFSEDLEYEDSLVHCPRCPYGAQCTCGNNSREKIVLVYRVILGNCYRMGTETSAKSIYTEGNIKAGPPLGSSGKPYDSVLYTETKKGKPYKRVAIYNPDHVYPEYAVLYIKNQQQSSPAVIERAEQKPGSSNQSLQQGQSQVIHNSPPPFQPPQYSPQSMQQSLQQGQPQVIHNSPPPFRPPQNQFQPPQNVPQYQQYPPQYQQPGQQAQYPPQYQQPGQQAQYPPQYQQPGQQGQYPPPQ